MNEVSTVHREGRVLSVDAGVAAFLIRTIRPILDEVLAEMERDDLPDLSRELLLKKRLSLEMLIHILRGNSKKREYVKQVRRTGQLHENEVDMATILVIADGPEGELEVIETDDDTVDAECEALEEVGYVTARYHVVPQTGHLIDVFWPILGDELVEQIEKDREVKAYLEAQAAG